MTAVFPGEVFVLANISPTGDVFVRWYHSHEQADGLFDSAVAAGGEGDRVVTFALSVPDRKDVKDVLKRAEDVAKSGTFNALRDHLPKTAASKIGARAAPKF